jgi:DegV family protein with EDD domain
MIHIVTDSTANLPADLAQKHNVRVLPTYVHFGPETLRDGVDITPADFYKRLASSTVQPTTSQLAVKDFRDMYTPILSDDPAAQIISIHVSGALSGTVDSARTAAGETAPESIRVVDTRSIGGGHALMVLEAARMVEARESLTAIIEKLDRMIAGMQVRFVLETLDYLAKSGRIGRAARMMGTMLDMKPILTLKDGAIDGLERQRGLPQARTRLETLTLDGGKGHKNLHLAVLHANCEEDARKLGESLSYRLRPAVFILTDLSPAVGVYTGPGTLATCWWSSG